jgi:hypothetical protein
MKKHITILSAVLLAGSTIFTSCKKDDVTAPVVSLNGGDESIFLQGTFVDMGATANDNKDGSLATSVSGNVDVNHTGTYQLTYTATDAAGNSGTATRNVTVVNSISSNAILGTYACTITPGNYQYTQTVSASETLNNAVVFSYFADYANNNTIYATVVGNVLTIPSQQSAVAVGNPAAFRTFAGSGTKTSSTINLSYTENTGSTSITNSEVMVKQ